jgi:hypothetical protein
MPSNKNRLNKKKTKNNKSNKNTKKYYGGKNKSKKSMKGGGDFFIAGNEPASFNNVPMHSFYTKNMLAEGTDVQHMQQSSRLLGGSKKNKKYKNKKGGGISNWLLGGFSNPIHDAGGIRGLPSSSNILSGRDVPGYASIPVNMQRPVPLV